jgi:hypothetical protein
VGMLPLTMWVVNPSIRGAASPCGLNPQMWYSDPSMRLGEQEVALVEALLRRKLEERYPRQSRERAQFDRKIGKEGSGWTSKSLRGDPKAGSPSLQTVLAVVIGLDLSPGEFFAEAIGGSSREDDAVRQFMAHTEEARDSLRPLVEELVLEALERKGNEG